VEEEEEVEVEEEEVAEEGEEEVQEEEVQEEEVQDVFLMFEKEDEISCVSFSRAVSYTLTQEDDNDSDRHDKEEEEDKADIEEEEEFNEQERGGIQAKDVLLLIIDITKWTTREHPLGLFLFNFFLGSIPFFSPPLF
jgi:hypothetical protein